MEIKRFEGTGRMSRAVTHNNTLYLCGQTCKESGKDVKDQTKIVLKNIVDLLEKYGSSKNSILSVTIYIKEIGMFAEMNEIWDNWVEEGHEPARACVEAKMAREDIYVEMSVIAAIVD